MEVDKCTAHLSYGPLNGEGCRTYVADLDGVKHNFKVALGPAPLELLFPTALKFCPGRPQLAAGGDFQLIAVQMQGVIVVVSMPKIVQVLCIGSGCTSRLHSLPRACGGRS